MASVLPLHITSRKVVKIAVRVFEKTQTKKEKCAAHPARGSQAYNASVRRPALASHPDTGKQATSAPCRQIDRNGTGQTCCPPPALRSLGPGKEIPHSKGRADSAPCWTCSGSTTESPVHALAGKPARAEKRQRGAPALPSNRVQTDGHTKAKAAYQAVDGGYLAGMACGSPVRCASREMGSRGVGSTQQDDTRIQGGEGGRAGGGGERGASAAARKAGEGRNAGENSKGRRSVMRRGRRESLGSEDEARHGEHAAGEEGVQAENEMLARQNAMSNSMEWERREGGMKCREEGAHRGELGRRKE
ncbi:hypothetical protein DFH09DRAFT_1282813 [Mycena vulgaris]|nr:hypothetical protein DFH09DRAFT_1282813 [Mycena vulgaris]